MLWIENSNIYNLQNTFLLTEYVYVYIHYELQISQKRPTDKELVC
jgi:hypothetical protein